MAKIAHVVSVAIGYGHDRAAYALQSLAPHGITAFLNEFEGMPFFDVAIWKEMKAIYEVASRFKAVPVLGDMVFSLVDKAQEIKDFYPRERLLEQAGFFLKLAYSLMENRAWGKYAIQKLAENPMPLVVTHPLPALMAEYFEYPGPIVCVTTDTDITRAWAPLSPKKTRITYAASTHRVRDRLLQYGVPEKNIVFTGFPLPNELESSFSLKDALRNRLVKLDPCRVYMTRYADVARRYLGKLPMFSKKKDPVSILFSVGGAGAQENIVTEILDSLKSALTSGVISLTISVGIRKDIAERVQELVKKEKYESRQVGLVFAEDKNDYFVAFNKAIQSSDVLWTKPSELSFYAGLGIPVVMARPIGAQEEKNEEWLLLKGAGLKAPRLKDAVEWFEDSIQSGLLAEAAMQGFVEVEKMGTKNIRAIVEKL